MDTIIVPKTQLIEKLKENLESHQGTFEKAQARYKERVIELLEEQLEIARKGRQIDRRVIVSMPVPENHADDYRFAIEMLDVETRDEIELTQSDFRRYWRDEWEWRHTWASNTESYVAG